MCYTCTVLCSVLLSNKSMNQVVPPKCAASLRTPGVFGKPIEHVFFDKTKKKSSMQFIFMQGVKSVKRKARSEEGNEGAAAGRPAGQSRKVVKRAQGLTPSRKGPALRGQSPGPSHCTPLRHLNGGRGAQRPSRLAHSTHAADIENAAKSANGGTPAALVGFLCQTTSLISTLGRSSSIQQSYSVCCDCPQSVLSHHNLESCCCWAARCCCHFDSVMLCFYRAFTQRRCTCSHMLLYSKS